MANENAGYFTRGMATILPGSLSGSETVGVDTQSSGGVSPQTGALTTTTLGLGVQTVAAAGTSQGTATAIAAAGAIVFVTVTASTEGIKLPTAAQGLRYTVYADPAIGNKVYPATGALIAAGATNAAYTLVKDTATTFVAFSATKWRVLKGS